MLCLRDAQVMLTKKISFIAAVGVQDTLVLPKAIEVLWNLVQTDNVSVPASVIKVAQERLHQIVGAHGQRGERIPFLLRCVENIRMGKSVAVSLELMWHIINFQACHCFGLLRPFVPKRFRQ